MAQDQVPSRANTIGICPAPASCSRRASRRIWRCADNTRCLSVPPERTGAPSGHRLHAGLRWPDRAEDRCDHAARDGPGASPDGQGRRRVDDRQLFMPRGSGKMCSRSGFKDWLYRPRQAGFAGSDSAQRSRSIPPPATNAGRERPGDVDSAPIQAPITISTGLASNVASCKATLRARAWCSSSARIPPPMPPRWTAGQRSSPATS